MRLVLVSISLITIAALAAMKPLLNISPASLPAALDVATGLGAKLACSGRYISGISAAQMAQDLNAYSAAYALVNMHYDDEQQQATAALGGLASASATYRDKLGCTLDMPQAGYLDTLSVPVLEEIAGEWPTGSNVATVQAGAQRALDARLTADNAAGYQSRALLVLKGGNIIAESAAANFSTTEPLLGWSMGKSVTAILLGLLENSGAINPRETAIFAHWQNDGRSAISLQQLLQMSSGLAFDEAYSPGSDATYMLSAAPSASAVALSKPLEYPPGNHFAYSSGTTNLLARLLHERLGNDTAVTLRFLYQRLFAPLGIRTMVLEPDPSGVFVGSSYVYASARDWARLGLLMLQQGEFNGQRLLSRDWIERATAANPSQNEPRYGYQFWLNRGGDTLRWPDLPEDSYAMQGNRGQVVMIMPSLDTVVVRLGWSAQEYPTNDHIAALLQQLTTGYYH